MITYLELPAYVGIDKFVLWRKTAEYEYDKTLSKMIRSVDALIFQIHLFLDG